MVIKGDVRFGSVIRNFYGCCPGPEDVCHDQKPGRENGPAFQHRVSILPE